MNVQVRSTIQQLNITFQVLNPKMLVARVLQFILDGFFSAAGIQTIMGFCQWTGVCIDFLYLLILKRYQYKKFYLLRSILNMQYDSQEQDCQVVIVKNFKKQEQKSKFREQDIQLVMSYQVFKIEHLNDGQIIKVVINRPKAMNAMNPKFFEEFQAIFHQIQKSENVRVVVLLADGKVFTAGLDLKEYGSLFAYDLQSTDSARISAKLYDTIRDMQQRFLLVAHCRVPVLVGIHSKCVGGGIDLTSMCDIRYCSQDAQFTIKQIDIGMAADLGTLQFFPNNIGNQSAFRELAYTGRFMNAKEALQIGFVNKVVPNRKQLQVQLMKTAEMIASKSPVGIYTLKQVIKRQYLKKVEDSLDYIARINSATLLTKDTTQAITAFLQKRKPVFSKL